MQNQLLEPLSPSRGRRPCRKPDPSPKPLKLVFASQLEPTTLVWRAISNVARSASVQVFAAQRLPQMTFLQTSLSTANMIFMLIGFHLFLLRVDVMHVFPLGVLQATCGSMIWELICGDHCAPSGSTVDVSICCLEVVLGG